MTMPLVFSVLSLILCFFFFFFFRWYIGRKTSASQLLADYRAEVHRLIAEIDGATDRDSLLVEERIKTLRKLLEDTDRRISVYMRELQRSRNGEAMYTSLGRGIRAALDSRPLAENKTAAAPEARAETAPAAEAGKQAVEAPVEPPAAGKRPAARERRGKKNRDKTPETGALFTNEEKPKLKAQIAGLSAQGLSSGEIASRLNISLAEVDLALNLLYRPDGK